MTRNESAGSVNEELLTVSEKSRHEVGQVRSTGSRSNRALLSFPARRSIEGRW